MEEHSEHSADIKQGGLWVPKAFITPLTPPCWLGSAPSSSGSGSAVTIWARHSSEHSRCVTWNCTRTAGRREHPGVPGLGTPPPGGRQGTRQMASGPPSADSLKDRLILCWGAQSPVGDMCQHKSLGHRHQWFPRAHGARVQACQFPPSISRPSTPM